MFPFRSKKKDAERSREVVEAFEGTDPENPTDDDLSRIAKIADRYVKRGSDTAVKQISKLRKKKPRWSPTRMERHLNKKFRRWARLEGLGVGTTAAVPGVGTIAAGTLSVGQWGVFLDHAADYVMGVAELSGIDTTDPNEKERLRNIFMTTLLGDEGVEVARQGLTMGSILLARNAAVGGANQSMSAMSRRLAKRLAKSGAKASARSAAGRMMPFGIGAFLGYQNGKAMAKSVISATDQVIPELLTEFPS